MIAHIQCASVCYRQGIIEIASDIHEGCVNIEIWNIAPDLEVPQVPRGPLFEEPGSVTGTIELELSACETEALIRALQEALLASR